MSILDCIDKKAEWTAFFTERTEHGFMNPAEAEALRCFIEEEGYLQLAADLKREDFCMQPPEKRLLNRLSSGKKRVVYSFSPAESYVLKLIAYKLRRYDAYFADSCCAFRLGGGARRAILGFTRRPDIDRLYCIKLDITNYFNSINIDLLLPRLEALLCDDPRLYAFLRRLLLADEALYMGETVREKRGVMAGCPVSPFLANLYLAELDRAFEGDGLPYARYSDDIIFFCNSPREADSRFGWLCSELSRLKLQLNPNKTRRWEPGEGFEFLGVEYRDGVVELSGATLDKLKGKLSRKARALRRWCVAKDAEPERAVRAYLRSVNRILYDNPRSDELTWTRWFFPIISGTEGLRLLDAYVRDCARYVATGRHGKGNYRIDYETLKHWGLRSLVNEYYKAKA